MSPFPVSRNFRQPRLLTYGGQWLGNFILPQDPRMHLIRSQGLEHLQVPQMVSNLIFSYCQQFFILPVLAMPSATWAAAGAFAGEDQGNKCLGLLHVPGNQVSHFLTEGAHIFPHLPFIPSVPTEVFLLPLMSLLRLGSVRADRY